MIAVSGYRQKHFNITLLIVYMRGSSPGGYFRRERAETQRESEIIASMKSLIKDSNSNLSQYNKTNNSSCLKLAKQSYDNALTDFGRLKGKMPSEYQRVRNDLEQLGYKLAHAKKPQ